MSFIKNIATYLLSLKESPKVNKQFFSWNQISKILIIAHHNQLSDIVEFINMCKKDSIITHVAVINEGKAEQAPKPHFEHTMIDKKQFSFFDIPHHSMVQKLNTHNFDVLINLGNSGQQKALSLSKLVSSKCKISRFQHPFFDITIEGDGTLNNHTFLQQVIVYLKMIKTNPK
jgi:hypothetical protein